MFLVAVLEKKIEPVIFQSSPLSFFSAIDYDLSFDHICHDLSICLSFRIFSPHCFSKKMNPVIFQSLPPSLFLRSNMTHFFYIIFFMVYFSSHILIIHFSTINLMIHFSQFFFLIFGCFLAILFLIKNSTGYSVINATKGIFPII